MTSLRDAAIRASARTEFAFVCLVAFGLFSVTSIAAAVSMISLSAGPMPRQAVFDQAAVVRLVIYEATVFVGLGWFLGVRGWTRAKIGLQPSWRASAIGVLLAGVALFVSAYLSSAVLASSDTLTELVGRTHPVAGQLSLGAMAALCIVNPLFEEVFVCGYLITALKNKRGPSFAANSSTAVRVLYHLYQGPLAVVGILPIGLLFGYWYARTARLWPLVVAHALLDAMALAVYQ